MVHSVVRRISHRKCHLNSVSKNDEDPGKEWRAGGWDGHRGHYGQSRQLEQKAQRGEAANRTVHGQNTRSLVLLEVMATSGRWEVGLERL